VQELLLFAALGDCDFERIVFLLLFIAFS